MGLTEGARCLLPYFLSCFSPGSPPRWTPFPAGGAAHVLLNDTAADHIAGCNSAFRRQALLAVGGWDPFFRIAGDDVDVVWRLQAGPLPPPTT